MVNMSELANIIANIMEPLDEVIVSYKLEVKEGLVDLWITLGHTISAKPQLIYLRFYDIDDIQHTFNTLEAITKAFGAYAPTSDRISPVDTKE